MIVIKATNIGGFIAVRIRERERGGGWMGEERGEREFTIPNGNSFHPIWVVSGFRKAFN